MWIANLHGVIAVFIAFIAQHGDGPDDNPNLLFRWRLGGCQEGLMQIARQTLVMGAAMIGMAA